MTKEPEFISFRIRFSSFKTDNAFIFGQYVSTRDFDLPRYMELILWKGSKSFREARLKEIKRWMEESKFRLESWNQVLSKEIWILAETLKEEG